MNISSGRADKIADWRSLACWQLGLLVILLLAANLSIAVSQVTLGACLALFLVRWRFFDLRPTRTRLEIPALLLLAWALLMIPFSTDPGQSLVFTRRFYLFSALWIAGTVATDLRSLKILVWALLAGALAISLYGQIRLVIQTGDLFYYRLGQMSNPMTSGCLLMMVLLVVAGFLLERGTGWRLRLGLAAGALPVFVGLIETMTRSAWLGLVAGLTVMLLVVRPRWLVVFLALLVAVPLLIGFLPGDPLSRGYLPRLKPSYILGGRSTQERVTMWRGGMAMVKRNPLVGVGDRDLRELGPDYFGDQDTHYSGHLHSNPVMLAVIWGVPGFLLGTVFLLAPGWLLWSRWRLGMAALDRAPPEVMSWILGALGVWAGFFVAGLTEWYFGDAETMLMYLAILGIALGASGKLVATECADAADLLQKDAHV